LKIKFALITFVCLIAAGCATKGPNYSPSIANAQLLKDAGSTAVAVQSFDSAGGKDAPYPITIRAASMESPTGGHYGIYLSEAIKSELKIAGRLAESSDLKIRGTLLKSDIFAASFTEGTAVLEARIIVRSGANERFNKVITTSHKWESSFVGAIAIPKAMNEYPVMVQKLISTLLSDKDFQAAIK
jgi:hypothetical protein